MEHKNSLGSRLQIRKIKNLFVFPSLFSRLVSVYISILVIMLIVLFVTFTQSFQSYFVKYTQEIMINQAKNIASEYHKAGSYSISKEEALNKIINRIQIMNSYMHSTTWVIDQGGNGYIITDDHISLVDKEVVNESIVQEVLQGQVIGFENGFDNHFSTPVLTIGYPISMDQTISYALLIHTPMPFILQTIDEVTNLILNVVGFIGSIVFIWIYTISKQMTKPLKEMNSVAKTIASGQFDKRINVKGNDEIAELGLSLNHMAEELDKIEENRRSFIANISHDLRSPLTSIQGFVTAVLDGTIDADHQERYLKIVLSEAQRLITMTNTILDLNQMQESEKPVEKIGFNINNMIDKAVLSLESRAKEKRVTISKEIDPEDGWVLGEVDSINRVIQNLLDNAFKFVNEGGHIIVRTTCRHNKIWVRILNNGPAIPEDQQKLIWERFYKADSSRGEDKKGVGLGLVIVKEIIKKHNEVIGVYSQEGEYVEFYFSLTRPHRMLDEG